jgi:hypothetical protein
VRSPQPVLAALAVVGALAVAGCSGDDPRASTTGSSTSTKSSSMTSSPTSTTTSSSRTTTGDVYVPPAATEHTEEGAKAFASYYMEQVSESYSTLETRTLTGLTADPCPGCQVLLRSIEQRKNSGEHARRRTFTADLTHIGARSSGGKLQIDVAGTEESVDVLDAKGVVLRKTIAGKVVFRTVVVWVGSSWLMSDVKVVTA